MEKAQRKKERNQISRYIQEGKGITLYINKSDKNIYLLEILYLLDKN